MADATVSKTVVRKGVRVRVPPSAPTASTRDTRSTWTPFYSQLDEATFASSPWTAGPWGADKQHAGPPKARVARAIERFEPRDGHGSVGCRSTSSEPCRWRRCASRWND